jgi:chromosome segregation ATPase
MNYCYAEQTEGGLRRRALAGECDAKRTAIAAATAELERLQSELAEAIEAQTELDANLAIDTTSADAKAAARQMRGRVAALQAAHSKLIVALPKLQSALETAEAALAEATAQQTKVRPQTQTDSTISSQ